MDLGAFPPHDSDPSKQPLPNEKVKVEKGYHDLTELTPPHGSRESRKVYHLLRNPTPEALAEVREILFETESRPVLTYIGRQLAQSLSPIHAPLARELLRLKELPSTDAFVRGLACRELDGVRRGLSSPLVGDEMAPLRADLAKFSVSPELYFSEKALERHGEYVEKLLLFPLVILRRCGRHEIAPTFVDAATTGSIDPSVSRRAIEGLTHVEETDPRHRVLSGESVATIARSMDSFFRNSLNRMDVYALVDRWLSKPGNVPSTDSAPVRAVLHTFWEEYRRGEVDLPVQSQGLNIMDVVALMRHFDDPASQAIVEEACGDPNAGISLLAQLYRFGRSPGVLTKFIEALDVTAPSEDRLSAVRVFAYPISPELDRILLPFFLHAARASFRDDRGNGPEDGRLAMVAGFARRLYTSPINSPFTAQVFAEALERNDEEASLVASTLVGIARQRRVMPLRFYDDPTLLAPIGVSIEMMRRSAIGNRAHMTALADEVEGHFILDGPARFGFQLTRTREKTSGTTNG